MNIKNLLKSHGKKATPERVELFSWMKKKHLFSSSDVEKDFSDISRASIFRSLKLFSEMGILRKISLGESGDKYEIDCCDSHHHEHMACKSCGDILSFASNSICNKIFSEAKKLGFTVDEHSLSIFGKCSNCNV